MRFSTTTLPIPACKGRHEKLTSFLSIPLLSMPPADSGAHPPARQTIGAKLRAIIPGVFPVYRRAPVASKYRIQPAEAYKSVVRREGVAPALNRVALVEAWGSATGRVIQ